MYVYIPKKLYYVTYMWNLKNQTHKNRDRESMEDWWCIWGEPRTQPRGESASGFSEYETLSHVAPKEPQARALRSTDPRDSPSAQSGLLTMDRSPFFFLLTICSVHLRLKLLDLSCLWIPEARSGLWLLVGTSEDVQVLKGRESLVHVPTSVVWTGWPFQC